ncbi:flagellar hook protein FlgE [Thermolongibacillus altinsuensis]
MLRSMYSGIGGMRNFQVKLDVIGNNIANVNTYGFKKGRVTFKDLMSQTISGASRPGLFTGGQNPKQVGLGATLASIDTVDTQGSLQTTGRVLDIGINGDGYFAVAQGNNLLYTRAGNFYLDANGTLVTADGYRVQGYPVKNGVVDYNTITDIVLDTNTVMPPSKTTYVNFDGNLDVNTTTGNTVTINFKVKDQIGRDVPLTITFTKNASNWGVTITESDPDPDVSITSGTTTISFDATGRITSGSPFTLQFKDADNNNQSITLDFSKMTQFASPTTASVDKMDGNSEGYLESFNIGASGEVNGVFSNGQVRVMGQLAIATFANNGGLMKAGNNYFQASNNSGLPDFGVAGEGRGTLQSGALEMSNVDLAEEFTEMIVAQRGFQANTRIITTSDEILQELVNLKK